MARAEEMLEKERGGKRERARKAEWLERESGGKERGVGKGDG